MYTKLPNLCLPFELTKVPHFREHGLAAQVSTRNSGWIVTPAVCLIRTVGAVRRTEVLMNPTREAAACGKPLLNQPKQARLGRLLGFTATVGRHLIGYCLGSGFGRPNVPTYIGPQLSRYLLCPRFPSLLRILPTSYFSFNWKPLLSGISFGTFLSTWDLCAGSWKAASRSRPTSACPDQ